MIKSGISQIGGKFRLRKKLISLTPRHYFFLSLFSGACHYELNKYRVNYECFNDLDSQYINYLLMIRQYPKEFNDLKKGVFGLVSQEICNRIVSGQLQPQDNIEEAYFFYYLNKLCFAGYSSNYYMGFKKTDSYSLRRAFRGITLPSVSKKDHIEKIKASFRGKSGYKGINPKTTRPYTNNDCGLLTPIDPHAIERLRYVNLTCYDFRKVYKLFHRAFHIRKGLEKECLIYADPPYPGSEKYYGNMFTSEDHNDLIEIMLETPFNFMLSIGGQCEDYLNALKDWDINLVEVRYSLSSNDQYNRKEYIITNYKMRNDKNNQMPPLWKTIRALEWQNQNQTS